MKYNWQQDDWPHFRYNLSGVQDILLNIAEKTGQISGMLQGLSENAKTETVIQLMVTEAVKTSEIEGEYISRKDVMSSICNQLGLNKTPQIVNDQRAVGVAELMIAVQKNYKNRLSKTTLFSWHKMLLQGSNGIKVGAWRTHADAMQVISGVPPKIQIHFEAPPSMSVPQEMKQFIDWFNHTAPGSEGEITSAPIRSAIAHLYFESIHPFEDGNGRIGRAISEKALSQSLKRPAILSLSRSIEENKKQYYDQLEQAQRSNEITDWITYFCQTILETQITAENIIAFTLKKTKFLDKHKSHLNQRQQKAIHRMLEEGPQGFEGGMSAKKYITITKTSKATATRDLQDLVSKQIFVPIGGGRSARYELNLEA